MPTSPKVVIVGSGPSSLFLCALFKGRIPKPIESFSRAYWPNLLAWEPPTVEFVDGAVYECVILGDEIGGMWKDNDPTESVSYGWQLDIPQLPFLEYMKIQDPLKDPLFYRPRRGEVSKYYKHVQRTLNLPFQQCTVFKIQATNGRYMVHTNTSTEEADIVILCTGRYTVPKSLGFTSDFSIPAVYNNASTVLVIGSGFSAADTVLLYLKWGAKVYHVMYMLPQQATGGTGRAKVKQSPLHYCHASSYPDYAKLYKLIKDAKEWKCIVDGQLELQRAQAQYVPLPGFSIQSPCHLTDMNGKSHPLAVDHHHTLIGYSDERFAVSEDTIYLPQSPDYAKYTPSHELPFDGVFLCGSNGNKTLIRECLDDCYRTYLNIVQE